MELSTNFFQAEDGIRDSVASRGLGDVYKRQPVKRQPASELRLGCFPVANDRGGCQNKTMFATAIALTSDGIKIQGR